MSEEDNFDYKEAYIELKRRLKLECKEFKRNIMFKDYPQKLSRHDIKQLIKEVEIWVKMKEYT